MEKKALDKTRGVLSSPKYRFERCQKVKGICKTFCDDDEYDYGYCIKWRNQCCI
ncbi:beta-defensin 110-like [Choloepus didactylus]|uniref:beta-defensin 110-like n=1 Tax=Choloepus didactylus TaxID=27675 RepID=UPI00189E58DD|nr:beta-defensin 110-like [Choloepus didactylus]